MKVQFVKLAVVLAAALPVCGASLAAPLEVASPLGADPIAQTRADSSDINDVNRSNKPTAREPESTGNPLWAVPLAALSETRERPLFTPTRRAPLPTPTRIAVPPRPTPKSVEPERPRLTLVGTIVGNTEGFGLFIDSTTKAVIRLKTGASYQGWTLHAVREREADLEKNYLRTTLSLPTHEDKGATGPRGSIQPSGKFSNLAKKN